LRICEALAKPEITSPFHETITYIHIPVSRRKLTTVTGGIIITNLYAGALNIEIDLPTIGSTS
jgi:hypothetical protein